MLVSLWAARELLNKKKTTLFTSEYPIIFYSVVSGFNELLCVKVLIMGMAE